MPPRPVDPLAYASRVSAAASSVQRAWNGHRRRATAAASSLQRAWRGHRRRTRARRLWTLPPELRWLVLRRVAAEARLTRLLDAIVASRFVLVRFSPLALLRRPTHLSPDLKRRGFRAFQLAGKLAEALSSRTRDDVVRCGLRLLDNLALSLNERAFVNASLERVTSVDLTPARPSTFSGSTS